MEYLESNEIMDYLQVIYLHIIGFMQRYEQRIFFRKKESDLLSLISFGIEFQSCAPSYMKLFFILFVKQIIIGKQRLLEMSQR